MAKKEWTPEERIAFGAKMRAAKQAKTNTTQPTQTPTIPDEVYAEAAQPVDHGNPQIQDYDDLQKQILELKGYLFDALKKNPPSSGVNVSGDGIKGTLEKYILSAEHYPDPRERLAQEAKLQRFAFPMNFELEWKVGITQYQTKDGLNVKEPKFNIQLNRIVMDEETGEATDGRYVITNAIFHEDPEAAIAVAAEQGVEVGELEEKAFLDEMRYLRIRDWLLEAFYTPLPASSKSNKREVVVNGKLVQYFEVNNEDGKGVDFSKLPVIKF